MKHVFPYKKAICYSGYRDGQSPRGQFPTREQIMEDLKILVSEGFECIRMYDPNDYAQMVLDIIQENNLPLTMMIGIDSQPEINAKNSFFGPQNLSEEELSNNAKRNDAELDKLIVLANKYPDIIVAVSVGNENRFEPVAHLVSEERLISHAKKLHKMVKQPITFNEDMPEWEHITTLVDNLDFISIHHYPYHLDININDALDNTKKAYEKIAAMYPDKQVIFTEVGWSTRCSGNDYAPGHASVENQKRYNTEISTWLEEAQITGFLFEAFDEIWKADKPEATECNWGIYDINRHRKW
ncbi:MAG: glycosyl hydrolase family 17 protein [Wujia sp.]